jgi:tetratricopeptide (TPR) repeat protein
MATRLIVREAEGAVQVSLHRPGLVVAEPAGPPQPFPAPLSAQEMEDLRWYLEDYLQAPFAVYEKRGAAVQARIDEWGTRLFDVLFGTGKPGRDSYLRAGAAGEWSLWLVSASPAFLSLPWELMRDPLHVLPLALEVSVSRTIDVQAAPAPTSGEEMRVLMVIARPAGERDAGYRVIARSLVDRLSAVSGRVTLDVVRPPTLVELRRRLKRAREEGRPYQVVHFDGHGTFVSTVDEALRFDGAAARGYLLFEAENGGADSVPAEDFGAVLTGAGVPLLVFNACRSAALADGGAAEAAVATRVLHAGAAAVVAMSYSVYVVAAAEFMAAFYEALFQGDTVEEAVRAGRQQLHRASLRPSPRGMLPLDDWMVPVHYARMEVRFPHLAREHRAGDAPSLDALLERMRPVAALAPDAGVHAERSLDAAAGVFIGRDRDFLRLEAALWHHRVVVLHGMGGTGKTELAKGFARWLRDSGGVDDPDWIFFHSFEPGIASFGLQGVVTGIGLRLFGPDFVRQVPKAADRAEAILQFLREHCALLVWDNFETVVSMPDLSRTTPPLGPAERDEVHAFLAKVARSARGRVIITSRSPEEWLGDVHRLVVGGLDRDDAVQYAEVLLASHPAAQLRRSERAFGELLGALGGHPLSMRLTLPYLDEQDPAALLRSLREAAAGTGAADTPAGRLASLDAGVSYSFQHLPESDRRLLPALAIFEGAVDPAVLRTLSMAPGVPARFHDIAAEDWRDTLERCVEVGLLDRLGGLGYGIHPALPPYLHQIWRDQAGDAYATEVVAVRRAGAWACSGIGQWVMEMVDQGEGRHALWVARYLRRTLGRMALLSLESGEFADVVGMLRALFEVLNAEGAFVEVLAWVERCLVAVEGPAGELPDVETEAGQLWRFAAEAEAGVKLALGDAAGAEATYQRFVSLHEARGEAGRTRLASPYHHLGVVAQMRGRPKEAREWYEKSLALKEEAGDRPAMALTYHQLGCVAHDMGDMEAAEAWFQRSLAITEELDNRPVMGKSYHQLGILAAQRGNLPAAEEWYQKSLAIAEELGDRPGMALTYHQLGIVAQDRKDLAEAEEWLRKSLVIHERIGKRPAMAGNYHQLGLLAEDRGDPAGAEEWYHKSLEIEKELGDHAAVALTSAQLALLMDTQGRPEEALVWTVRSVSLFHDFPNRFTGTAPRHMVRLTQRLGMGALERVWEQVTREPLPFQVGEVVRVAIEELKRMEAGDGDDG